MPQRTLAASSRADRARLAERHPMPAHPRRQPQSIDGMKQLASRSTWWHRLPHKSELAVNAAEGRGQPWTILALMAPPPLESPHAPASAHALALDERE